MEVKKKRGRPPLSPEEREAKRKESKRKYNISNPDIVKKSYQNYINRYDRLVIDVPKKYRPKLNDLLDKTGFNITTLFLKAVEDKYGIKLSDK